MALTWLPATGCAPEMPFPGVASSAPQRTLEVEAGVRGFWPVSEVRTVAEGHTAQDFIVADFLADRGSWRVCSWTRAVREQFTCTSLHCP